jgi:hypothetical protein
MVMNCKLPKQLLSSPYNDLENTATVLHHSPHYQDLPPLLPTVSLLFLPSTPFAQLRLSNSSVTLQDIEYPAANQIQGQSTGLKHRETIYFQCTIGHLLILHTHIQSVHTQFTYSNTHLENPNHTCPKAEHNKCVNNGLDMS